MRHESAERVVDGVKIRKKAAAHGEQYNDESGENRKRRCKNYMIIAVRSALEIDNPCSSSDYISGEDVIAVAFRFSTRVDVTAGRV